MHIVFACQETLSFPILKDLKLMETLNHTFRAFVSLKLKLLPLSIDTLHCQMHAYPQMGHII
jgi:hypothetical protein